MNICCKFYHSLLGKKIIVALTGLVMVGFVFVHMLGHLQIFAGYGYTLETTKINEYAAFLKKEALVLWGARIFLLLTIVTHIVTTLSLVRINQKARPVSYEVRKSYASAASRMMLFAGLTILAFIIYHILHFTTGTLHPDYFDPKDVYMNMILSFQNPYIALVYIVAQTMLFLHLFHGVESMFRTLGFYKPSHIAIIKKISFGFAFVVCAGFISVPLSIWIGWIGV